MKGGDNEQGDRKENNDERYGEQEDNVIQKMERR